MPDCRFVVITWVENDDTDDDTDAFGGQRNAWALPDAEPAAIGSTSEAPQRDGMLKQPGHQPVHPVHALSMTASLTVRTPEEAADLAGDDAIPLPALSRIAGPDVQLTLDPERGSVIWAVKEAAEWGISDLKAAAVLNRLPHAFLDPEARPEVELLVRASLPSDPSKARAHVEDLVTQLRQRIDILESMQGELVPGSGTVMS
jgi:hypothetical protein